LLRLTANEIETKIESKMNFTKLVPSVFYADILDGIKLFVECLQFAIEHKDLNASQPFCVLQRDGISIMVVSRRAISEGTLSRVKA
jgi:hypothetical protein